MNNGSTYANVALVWQASYVPSHLLVEDSLLMPLGPDAGLVRHLRVHEEVLILAQLLQDLRLRIGIPILHEVRVNHVASLCLSHRLFLLCSLLTEIVSNKYHTYE